MSSSPGLLLASSINIHTDEGQHEIQLMMGDITKLPVTDKVDLIMVSAFPCDYIPMKGTVIGALSRAFNLNVAHLAKDKAEDLRKNFGCWFSQPLDDELPYRRLLCFERSFNADHPSHMIGDLFRCLIPAFNNEACTVITPVLASGNQNFDVRVMLKSMVNAAANWIKAGLPLMCLKIVIYTRREYTSLTDVDDKILNTCIDAFNKLKKNWESRKLQWKEPGISYDVFLSYSEEDKNYVDIIAKQLHKQQWNLRIYSGKHKLNVEKCWQQEIYDAMIACLRVIPVLTQNYLNSEECIEEYNIALCCNRLTQRDLLAPFYLKTIEEMPTYMQITQYIDIRIEFGMEKTIKGIHYFVQRVLRHAGSHSKTSTDSQYDVFISYCHKNSQKALNLLEELQKAKTDMKIFFDRQILRTDGRLAVILVCQNQHLFGLGVRGHHVPSSLLSASWQQMLYDGIDNSKVVICLISNDYMESAVCTEEYNLALACHMCRGGLELIPVLIENVSQLKQGFTYVPILDAVEKITYPSLVTRMSTGLAEMFECDVMSLDEDLFHINRKKHSLEWLMEQSRLEFYENNFNFNKTLQLKQKSSVMTVTEDENVCCKISDDCEKKLSSSSTIVDDTQNLCDVFISVNVMDRLHGICLKQILLAEEQSLVVHVDSVSNTSQLSKLEQAKLVVAIVSPAYCASKKDIEEFHSALCRQRSSAGKQILFVVHASNLLQKPTFMHLVPADIACSDKIWTNIQNHMRVSVSLPFDEIFVNVWHTLNGKRVSIGAFTALVAAAKEICNILAQREKTKNNNVLLRNIVAVNTCSRPNEKVELKDEYLKKVGINLTDNKNSLDNEAGSDVKRNEGTQDEVLELNTEHVHMFDLPESDKKLDETGVGGDNEIIDILTNSTEGKNRLGRRSYSCSII